MLFDITRDSHFLSLFILLEKRGAVDSLYRVTCFFSMRPQGITRFTCGCFVLHFAIGMRSFIVQIHYFTEEKLKQVKKDGSP